MKRYTRAELEDKVSSLNKELSNPSLIKSDNIRISNSIKYYINKLVELDEQSYANTIEA